MLTTDKFGHKVDLSFLSLEERDIMNFKLYQLMEMQQTAKRLDWDHVEIEDIPKVTFLFENFKNLMKRVNSNIEIYLELCHKAQVRLIVEVEHLVSESEIISLTKDYPGLDVFYKTILKIKNPDYIYALMMQTVLKQREINKPLAKAILRNQTEFTYAELEGLDEGAAVLGLQRAFMKISDILAGKSKPDLYQGEFCFIQNEDNEVRAIFISVAKRNAKQPNITLVKNLLGVHQVSFEATSEVRLDSTVDVKINCGSVGKTPVPIIVKVPYFMRSYIVKKYK